MSKDELQQWYENVGEQQDVGVTHRFRTADRSLEPASFSITRGVSGTKKAELPVSSPILKAPAPEMLEDLDAIYDPEWSMDRGVTQFHKHLQYRMGPQGDAAENTALGVVPLSVVVMPEEKLETSRVMDAQGTVKSKAL